MKCPRETHMIKDIKNYLTSKPRNVLFFEASTYLFVGTLPLLLKINTIILWFFILGSILTFKNREPLVNLKKKQNSFISSVYVIWALYNECFFIKGNL